MSDEPLRPDPDRLLQHTAAPHRGKLKVFFGACAGVGKTWAMLAEAQRLRAQGLDILIGVAETHGRKETAAMLQGLSSLPPRRQAAQALQHRGGLFPSVGLRHANQNIQPLRPEPLRFRQHRPGFPHPGAGAEEHF